MRLTERIALEEGVGWGGIESQRRRMVGTFGGRNQQKDGWGLPGTYSCLRCRFLIFG
jgi:hypothetical protein